MRQVSITEEQGIQIAKIVIMADMGLITRLSAEVEIRRIAPQLKDENLNSEDLEILVDGKEI